MATSTQGVMSLDERIRVVPFALSSVAENSVLDANMPNVDAVVHSAALLPYSIDLNNPVLVRKLFFENIMGTFDLAERVVSYGIRHFILISATNLFQPDLEIVDERAQAAPIDIYRLSKWFCEEITVFFGKNNAGFCALRVSAPYGPNYKTKAVIPTFVERALDGMELNLWGGGLREQTFTYVQDIASACERVIERDVSGVYNIAGPRSVTMKELAEIILQVVGNTGAKIAYTGKFDPSEAIRRQIPIDRASLEFGYVPQYDLYKGIAEMVTQLKNPLPPLYIIE